MIHNTEYSRNHAPIDNYSRNHAPTYWPEVAIHDKKTVESRYSTILQPTQVSMGLNSRNLQHLNMQRVLHHVRDAVVSGNTFEHIDGILT